MNNNRVPELDKLEEECGVFGCFSNSPIDASVVTYYGLYSLQHRGQESAGIAVSNGERIMVHKGMGLVSEVFSKEKLDVLKGSSAIGHVRYSTTGDSDIKNSQPLDAETKLGPLSISHNGNIVNADVLRDLLEDTGRLFQTSSDSEVILNLIARAYKKGLPEAVSDAANTIQGSYAIIILSKDSMVGARDRNGIRPLCIGRLGDAWVFASESCALDTIGAEFVRDVKPGEIVIADKDGLRSINNMERTSCQTCSFEYIYFARPDSVIDEIDVYEMRCRSGERLYEECPVEADIISGVPNSGIPAAVGYSKKSGIPYEMTLIKNKYVGRTFITPSQELREKAVNVKLNVMKNSVKGKRVVLIDDSVVRGTTSRKLVEMLRAAGATEVHLRVASPPVAYPCYFGIDTPYRNELIGSEGDIEAMNKTIGADSLGYLSREGLLASLGGEENFCMGCFTGVYPVAAQIGRGKDVMGEQK
ncbi:MAG: amidophosphoribosyltransferase [Spirochaetia bacterium]|jgi:amidophosphoribosyltransferase|nr:amidophosphoribosyltransferase [Spirochaetia bacterium]